MPNVSVKKIYKLLSMSDAIILFNLKHNTFASALTSIRFVVFIFLNKQFKVENKICMLHVTRFDKTLCRNFYFYQK